MKWKKSIAIVIILIAFLLLLTPLNISQYRLNAAQRQSLQDALIDKDAYSGWGEEIDFKNSAIASSLDIFGISGLGKTMTVYGYFNDGLYIEARNKGYEISGGLYEIMADIRVNGDKVEVIKTYGDGVSTMTTLKEMPIRYRCKWSIYTNLGLYQKLIQRTNNSAAERLGVPVDGANTLSLDEEDDSYMIYDWDNTKNEPIVKHKGDISELEK